MRQWNILLIAVALMFAIMNSPSMGQQSTIASNGISAAVVASQLKALGYPAEILKDDSGDPWVRTAVDGFEWGVIFFNCSNDGELKDRNCDSVQFYSSYIAPRGLSLETINKWNDKKRYAKAYIATEASKKTTARIEIDLLIAGTTAEPAAIFRAYLTKMKNAADGFREFIGCSPNCTQTRLNEIGTMRR